MGKNPSGAGHLKIGGPVGVVVMVVVRVVVEVVVVDVVDVFASIFHINPLL